MRRFLHGIGNAFLTIVVLILLVYAWMFVQIKLLVKSYPEAFGYVFYLQEEADMTPEFELQDVVLVKKGQDYSVGDIVMFFDRVDSKYKVHKVVSKNASMTVTRCTTCDENDEAITSEYVVGKAIGKVAFMGAIVGFFSQKIVLIVFGIVGIIFLVVSQYFEYKPSKRIKKITEDEEIKK